MPSFRRHLPCVPLIIRIMFGASSFGAALACHTKGPTSPADLTEAFAAALKADDPDAAYALLSPALRAEISREQYRARWRELRPEGLEMMAAAQRDDGHPNFALAAETRYRNGVALQWAQLSESDEGRGKYARSGFVIVDGLPTIPDTSTPLRALHALVAALRHLEPGPLAPLVDAPTLEQMRRAWRDRADAIENALRSDDALVVDQQAGRAVLRYAPGQAVVLERRQQSWKITNMP